MGNRVKIALLITFVIVAIQFVQPLKNNNKKESGADIGNAFNTPLHVNYLLRKACYDCHSNNTEYPWYSNVEPIGWIMARHIRNGKEKLNFSNFAELSKRKQVSKLREIAGQIKDDAMPLFSYKLMHKEARLSDTDRKLLLDWITAQADSLENKQAVE